MVELDGKGQSRLAGPLILHLAFELKNSYLNGAHLSKSAMWQAVIRVRLHACVGTKA